VRSGDSRYRVCAQLSPSHRHAGDLRSLGSAGVRGRMARRGDILVACRRGALGISHPVHIDRDPANQQALLSPALDRRSAEAERLLTRWDRLHAVRSVLSGLALLLFVYLATLQVQ